MTEGGTEKPLADAGLGVLKNSLARHVQRWVESAIIPRLKIARLLPTAGRGLGSSLVVINVVLGLLPVAFILSTSAVVGRVPAAVANGSDSAAFGDLVVAFLCAAGSFAGQQMLVPIQMALGERIKRRVDGRLRDQAVNTVMQSTSIGPMEDDETLSALSEATRLFDGSVNTPGMACAGLLALIARYVRLVAILLVVANVATWPAAASLGGAVLLFRIGNRGGLRKYFGVWRQVAGVNRRVRYLRHLAMGGFAAKELRIFGAVDWLIQRYTACFFEAYERVAVRRREIYLKPYLAYTPIGLAVGAWVMALLARRASLGLISLSEVVVGLQAVTMALLLGEFYAESDVPTQYGMQTVAALDEVQRRVRRFQPSSARGLPVLPLLPTESLMFDRVSFRYPGASRMVLSGPTFELRAGKSTAIVGINGAGKTTLVKLLTRLYEPTGGTIRADGIDIAAFNPMAWRRQVSVIFQDFIRYELSAADNIAFGAPHVPRDQRNVEWAAEQAGILESLSALRLGLQTPLARAYQDGVDLSGGQWQRVAIARSLYALRAGARILIMDEPTSALDIRAEAAFFDRFVELTRGLTSLLISHRFSSVRRADHIVVIDQGSVVEQGSHADLMAFGGQYASLFRLQAERFASGMDAEGHRVGSTPVVPAR